MHSTFDGRRIHFAVMAIESGARNLGVASREMHDRLKKQNLIHSRLIGRYDLLHTQSLEWVADDIVETFVSFGPAPLKAGWDSWFDGGGNDKMQDKGMNAARLREADG